MQALPGRVVSDLQERELERRAAQGDPQAAERLEAARNRTKPPPPPDLPAVSTEPRPRPFFKSKTFAQLLTLGAQAVAAHLAQRELDRLLKKRQEG